MKVLIVTTAFPRWLGDGRGNFVFEAAKAIKGQGWDVRVIAMHTPGASTHEWMDGIEVIRPRYLPEPWEILAGESAGLPQAWRTNPWTRLAIIPFLVTHALAVMRYAADADIIHANWTLSGMITWLTYWWHRFSEVPEIPDGWYGTLVVEPDDGQPGRPIVGFVQLTNYREPIGDTFMAHDAFTLP